MVTLMPCSYLSAAPRCAGLIEKMIEIEPKVLHAHILINLKQKKIFNCESFSSQFRVDASKKS